jgi:hypothetical protein
MKSALTEHSTSKLIALESALLFTGIIICVVLFNILTRILNPHDASAMVMIIFVLFFYPNLILIRDELKHRDDKIKLLKKLGKL